MSPDHLAPGDRNRREFDALWSRPGVRELIEAYLVGRSTTKYRSARVSLYCNGHRARCAVWLFPDAVSGVDAAMRVRPDDDHPRSLPDSWFGSPEERDGHLVATEVHRIHCGTCGAVYEYRPARLLEATLRALSQPSRVVTLGRLRR